MATVKMARGNSDGPNEADVHPDEVENWKSAGWCVVEPNLDLRGKLPDDFPAFAALEAAGITTYGQARKVTDWTAVKGVGPANAAKIQSALAAKTDTEDE